MSVNDDLFEFIVKGIILSRGESGATIAEMRSDYNNLLNEPWPLADFTTYEKIVYLSKMDQINYIKSETGAYIWYVDCVYGLNEGKKGATMSTDAGELSSARRALNFDRHTEKKSSKVHANPPKPVRSNKVRTDDRTKDKSESIPTTSRLNGAEKVFDRRHKDSGYVGNSSSTHEVLSGQGSSSSGHEVLSGQSSLNSGSSEEMASGQSSLTIIQEMEENNNNGRRYSMQMGYLNEVSAHSQDQRTYVRRNWEALTNQFIPSISVNENWDMNGDIPILYDTELMGDNFFFHFAKVDLDCKPNESLKPKRIGLCVCGQTLQAAAQPLFCSTWRPKKSELIINLGSIDILMGRDLIDIKYDFLRLIDICERKGIRPILTTLAPLLKSDFMPHDPRIAQTLLVFNKFITDEFKHKYQIINIWSCFTNEKGKTLTDCYQPLSVDIKIANRKVTFALWNRIGRQRTYKAIKKALSERM